MAILKGDDNGNVLDIDGSSNDTLYGYGGNDGCVAKTFQGQTNGIVSFP